MRRVMIDKQPYTFPEDYAELTPLQQVEVSHAIDTGKTFNEICTIIALSLVGLKVSNKEPLVLIDGQFVRKSKAPEACTQLPYYYFESSAKLVHLLAASDIMVLTESAKSLFDINKRKNVATIRLNSAEPIPIYVGVRKYLGYERGLTDFTLEDFIDCETLVAEVEAGDDDAMYRFIARAYFRSRTLTDKALATKAAKVKRAISPDVAIAIRYNYEGQKVFLSSKFDKLFGASAGSSCIDPALVFDDYCKLVATLGAGDPTKHRDIKSTMLYDALYALQERINIIELNSIENAKHRL